MIYYVEDDMNVRELALYALRQAGLEAEGFESATPFRLACDKKLPDLILLDIMLPEIDGLTVLEDLRKTPSTKNIPVMMLTAKGTEYDKVKGLDAGADDYLAKPFGMMELVSRCKALLRRCSLNTPVSNEVLTCGPLTIDVSAHEASVDGKALSLTLKEYDLLVKLVSEKNHVLTRAQLLEAIWGITFIGETRTVDTHIQTLRKKLHKINPEAGALIRTIRGVGYCVKEDGD